METKARLLQTFRSLETNKTVLTIEVDSAPDIDSIRDKDLRVDIKPWRKTRSKDANALLWACLTEIAQALTPPVDKWDVYLQMLKRYGQSTYGVFKPGAVDYVRANWRETEIVGTIDVNGEMGVQMLLYFGSSSYDTKEFSVLLDGVIDEMRQMGLQPPGDAQITQALELWEKQQNEKKKHNSDKQSVHHVREAIGA